MSGAERNHNNEHRFQNKSSNHESFHDFPREPLPPINRDQLKKNLEICEKLNAGRIQEACAALATNNIVSIDVVEALINAFSWTENGERFFSSKAEERRFTLMNEGDKTLIISTLKKMGEDAPDSVIPVLFRGLRNESWAVQNGVAATLLRLKHHATDRACKLAALLRNDSSESWRKILKDLELLGSTAEAAIPTIIGSLASCTRTSERQRAVARVLYEIGKNTPSTSIPLFIEGLDSDISYVKTTVALAISKFGSDAMDATEAFYQMLFDRRPTCQRTALKAMSAIISPANLSNELQQRIELRALQLYHSATSYEVKYQALTTLGRIGTRDLVAYLLHQEIDRAHSFSKRSQNNPIILRRERIRFRAIYNCAAALVDRDHRISTILEEGICHSMESVGVIACQSIPIIKDFKFAKRYLSRALDVYGRSEKVRQEAILALSSYGWPASSMLREQMHKETKPKMKTFTKQALKTIKKATRI